MAADPPRGVSRTSFVNAPLITFVKVDSFKGLRTVAVETDEWKIVIIIIYYYFYFYFYTHQINKKYLYTLRIKKW